MFTGLVEHLATVAQVLPQPPGKRIEVDAGPVAEGAQIGDSVAINGCCLTVIEIDGERLAFEAGEETLSRTVLGGLVAGSLVNLERALRAGDRLGGHYVSGHVDALGQLILREEDPPWAKLWFGVPPELTRQMASKGSVTVDGVSLTLVDVQGDRFSVALIPHTLQATTLGSRAIGDRVNIETDLLAKYVQRQLETEDRWSTDKPPAT
ncbi:riboflavin synthase [Rosistilla oblonga]|uniref:riboflavin synthase n=1 Tax=Rosistilla oblonga TaxID=2527990 RepID=UPI003A96A7FA